MQITRLELRNIKGFEERVFEFPQRFHLLVGENGTGKSTAVEALAFTLQHDCTRVPDDFVRLKRTNSGGVRFERQTPSDATSLIRFDETDVLSYIAHESGATSNGWKIALDAFTTKDAIGERNLPITAYFAADRLRGGHPEPSAPRTKQQLSRMEGYRDSLDGKLAISDLFAWIREEQYAALQEGAPSLLFEIVKTAITQCIPRAVGIEYSVREYDVIIHFEDGAVQPFANLSDGQKIMFGLVADIAFRAAWMNPHLGDRVLQETEGVVLIDELDLHLHPIWQCRVVDDLKSTFPKIQFIATSHSPFIIQSLEPLELIVLDDAQPVIEYANRGLEEIARFVQRVKLPHTSQRYAEQKEASKTYFSLLRAGKKTTDPEVVKAKAHLDQLTDHFADNPAADALLEIQRLASEGNGE